METTEYWKQRAEYYEKACLKLYEATRDLVEAGPLVKLNVRKHFHWIVAQEAARSAIAFANLGPYLAKYGSTLPEALKEWEDLHGRD